jgi:restriction endonuclease S subunit
MKHQKLIADILRQLEDICESANNAWEESSEFREEQFWAETSTSLLALGSSLRDRAEHLVETLDIYR